MMQDATKYERSDAITPRTSNHCDQLSEAQLAELSDAGKQAEYLQEYLAQLRRQACPGCGESDVF